MHQLVTLERYKNLHIFIALYRGTNSLYVTSHALAVEAARLSQSPLQLLLHV